MVFEFLISAVIFFAIIIYVLNYLNTNISIYSGDFYISDLEGRAVQVSELLIKTQGIWEGNNPVSPGLAIEYPLLNSTKMQYLNGSCGTESGYIDLLEKLDLVEKPFLIEKPFYNIKIEINESGANLLDCSRPSLPYLPAGIPTSNVERFALSENNKTLKINVWIW